jgi:predicted trehalose synthase
MLRSVDYAAATATADAADLAGRAHLASHMRDAFLDGYLAGAGRHGARFLPPTPRARADWTTFFEIEKALYEVEYELNHRPSWASIPLTALRRLRDSANGIQRPAGAT